MIYGQPPLRRENDTTDIIGIRTLVLSLFWAPSSGELSPADLDREAPGIPDVSGGLYLIGAQIRPEGGGLRSFWTFEGINGDGKSPTFKNRRNSIDYRFEGGFSQLPLVQSDKWPALKAQYGAQLLDGKIIWPDTTPAAAVAGIGTQTTDSGDPNPMFGHDTFDDLNGTYFFRYAELAGTADFSGVGEIFESGSLPGQAPVFPGRNWRKAPPAPIRRGPVDDITEAYILSQEGGWNVPLYGKAGGGSFGLGGGLITGTLKNVSL